MLKKFNPIIQDIPILFSEDVYLFNDSGKVLAGRQGGEPLKNIFSIIGAKEYEFIKDNMFFSGLHPLLLISSKEGPILVDNSLFANYRTFIAIVPHFSREETLAIVKNNLKSIVLPSSRMKEELLLDYDIELNEEHKEFAERLLSTHRGAYYYRVHGKINGEISMMMSEIAYDFSRFCGCEIELSINGVGMFEMRNDLCIDSYIFALVSLLFLARNYSIYGKSKMDVYFHEMGVYFDFGFEIADEYKSISLLKEADELKNFDFRAYSRMFDCYFKQDDRTFVARAFPWFKHPDSADLKEAKRELIYNL